MLPENHISYHDLISLNSWLSNQRKNEIANHLLDIIQEFINFRELHIEKLKENNIKYPKNVNYPAWMSVSRTDSIKGWRLVLGFNDQRCSYRKNDLLETGCFNCGFYADTELSERATEISVFKQLQTALNYGASTGREFDVIEFLSDGSFIEDLSTKARERIIKEVCNLPNIQRILIETRPIGIHKNPLNLQKIISQLGNKKTLEIAIGFESADEFIRDACIHKGFDTPDFEKAVTTLAELEEKSRAKMVLIAYMLIKPAFLTTEESIIDTIKSLEYLDDLSERTGIKIVPKLEPSTIPEGTLSALLFKKEKSFPCHYNILNYWGVFEILTRASENPLCKNVFKRIRIGERNDMGDNIVLPAIYKDKEYKEREPVDKVLYEGIQEFNFHRDLSRVFSLLQNQDISSLDRWIKEELFAESIVRQKLDSSLSFV